MVYLALILLGIYSLFFIPVSLLPEIDAPAITIKISYPGKLAKEIEQSVTSTFRFYLQQVNRIESLESETRDNEAVISIRFKYGTDGDKAFFDINEKIDLAMSFVPREVQRPQVIQTSENDLPVFNINICYKDTTKGLDRMVELSQLVQFVFKKRLEQLPEVALTDITGLLQSEIRVIPDQSKLAMLGVTYQQIRNAIEQAMNSFGSIKYKQGQLVYDISFENEISKPDDIENLFIEAGGRVFRLGDIATITQCAQRSDGYFKFNGKHSISIAVLKTSNAKISELKTAILNQLSHFKSEFPGLEFHISNDQSHILDLSISNLRTSLILGIILAVGVMFLFIGDYRSPFIMAVTIPVSLIISTFAFHLIGLSVNIVSLAGLILGVGMMVDNSIVVIDNITQWKLRGASNEESVVYGTNEVITPLLSSMLTTCAVFLPLIFLSGIAGELFYDQAMAVTVGLVISFWVSITLIPTLYYTSKYFKSQVNHQPIIPLERPYLVGHILVEKRKKLALIITLAMLLATPFVFSHMDKQQIPNLSHRELIANITWSNNISVDENCNRFESLITILTDLSKQHAAYIGRQQFMVINGFENEENQLKVYVKFNDDVDIEKSKSIITKAIKSIDSNADLKFKYPETAFDRVFPTSSYNLKVKIYTGSGLNSVPVELVRKELHLIAESCNSSYSISIPDSSTRIFLQIFPERLLLYHIDTKSLVDVVRKELGFMKITNLSYEQQTLPVYFGGSYDYIERIIAETGVKNSFGELIPLRQLVRVKSENNPRSLFADANGLYYPINIKANENDAESIIKNLQRSNKGELYSLGYSGDYFKSKNTASELIVVLLVSVLLLYFIMAAQFESVWQPLIVLIELPVDFGLALTILWIFGGTVNVMSLIGLVVMGGIVINDSILKIDTINRLLNKGVSIEKAIKHAGVRRVKAIVMTSLTTILAIVPILFGSDIGSELQQPMSVVLIAGMTLGTLVSLFIIPLLFSETYCFFRRILPR